MQPKSLFVNYLLFFLLAGAVIFGSWYLWSWLYPPRPSPILLAKSSELTIRIAGDAAAASSAGVPGLGSATLLASQAGTAEYLAQQHYHPPSSATTSEAKSEPKKAPSPKP